MADTLVNDETLKATLEAGDEFYVNAVGNLNRKGRIDGIVITASQVSDFDTEVDNNTAVALNTAKTTNATHTGDVTGSGALTIAAGSVDIAMLSATGTPDGTTFLRGDNTWATPAGSGDMVLASAQTNTGIKTFDDTTMKLRNVAGTFDGYFVNTNTADRIYTLQDSSDTLVGRVTTDTLTNKSIDALFNTITNITSAEMTSDAGIAFTQLAALTSGNMLVGDVSNVAVERSIAGDVNIDNTGVTTIAAGSIEDSMIGTVASTSLSDTANIARLDAIQTFTTDNEFRKGDIGHLKATSISSTNIPRGALWVKTEKTSDMGDGLGAEIEFVIEDDAAVENRIGSIGVSRDGADTQGKLIIGINSPTDEVLTIDTAGAVNWSLGGNHTNFVYDEDGTGNAITNLANASIKAAAAIAISKLAITGTPDGTKFLRDDDTWVVPSGSGDMVLASIQTVTGAKTFGSAGAVGKLIVAGTTSGTTIIDATAVAGTTTVTLPAATDTLVGKATTDTFTNKTIDQDGTGNSITNIDVASVKSGSNILIADIPFIIDGGGSAITTGIKGDIVIDFDCTINSVTMLADQSGSVVVDIWKDTYANYPPTVADTITASAIPTITTALKSQDATLTGWTTAITAGDTLRFNVNGTPTSITRVLLSLKVTKTA